MKRSVFGSAACKIRSRSFAALALAACLVLSLQLVGPLFRPSPKRSVDVRPCRGELVDAVHEQTGDDSDPTIEGAVGKLARIARRAEHVEADVMEPSAFLSLLSRYTDDAKAVARLSKARYLLDIELAASRAALDDPTKGTRSTGQYPPADEADIHLPEPSTFVCRMLPDGFEVCGRHFVSC